MNDIIKLAAAWATQSTVQHARQSLAQGARAVVWNSVAACCVIAGSGCVLTAVWISALPHVGPVGAPLIVAGLLFSVAGGVIWFYRSGAAVDRVPPPTIPSAALLKFEGADFVKNHVGTLLLAAMIAGAVAARKEP